MNQQMKQAGKSRHGLMLVKRPVSRAGQADVVREGSTGQVVRVLPNTLMLPRVWAVAERSAVAAAKVESKGQPKVEVAFYRKYTEAMLKRYLRLSMTTGRVPSLLGRELFRGNVTSYRVHGFEDAVIFCFDVEKRLGRMQVMDQQLIKRIALQQYTQGEAAGMLGLSLRNCIRQYGYALDRLTEMFLEAGMLEPLESCQGGRGEEVGRSASF
ncbi:MAG: hypothetical protein HIU91_01405 [Acidobacteria bacterium]|nr:hypothetical protein [Acidobacteriota bacterium]